MTKKIMPPFIEETALAMVEVVQDTWNTIDVESILLLYSENSEWRSREQFIIGQNTIKNFLTCKFKKELDLRIVVEAWTFTDNRISVRCESEWRNSDTGQWFRTFSNEHWEFDSKGLIKAKDVSANDITILESQRKYKW